jgi:hypothetical protein
MAQPVTAPANPIPVGQATGLEHEAADRGRPADCRVLSRRSACRVRWAQSIGGVAVQDVQRLADCGDVAGGTVSVTSGHMMGNMSDELNGQRRR